MERGRYDGWICFAVALGVRLAHLGAVADSPLFDVLLIDSAFYDGKARAIAAGRGWGPDVYFMAPLYPYLLGALYSLVGATWIGVAALQSVLGAASCALVQRIGRHLGERGTGLAAGLVYATYAPAVLHDGALLTASVIVLLDLAGLWWLLRGVEGGRAHGRLLFAAGVALGLSALARANALLFVALAPLGIWRALGAWRPALRASLTLGGGVLLALLPATLRNRVVGGELVLSAANAGMNFYTGNHPGARGAYAPPDFLTTAEPEAERADYLAEAARRQGVGSLSAGEASRFWMGEGLAALSEDPARAAALLATKLQLFLHRVEAPTNLSFAFARDHSLPLRLLPVQFGLLAPLAVAGLTLLRRRERLLLGVYLATPLATCLLFFVSAEYRLPAAPVAAVLAVHGARGIWARRGRLATPGGAVVGAALVAGLALTHWPTALTRSLESRRLDYYNFARLYLREGRLAQAEPLLERSLAIDPRFPLARQALAGVYRETERGDQADLLMAELALDERLARARTALEAGDPVGAEALYLQALALDPPDPARVLLRLGQCAAARGEHPRAIDYLRRALDLRPDLHRARVRLAESLLASGDREGARAELETVLARQPRHAAARRALDSLGDG